MDPVLISSIGTKVSIIKPKLIQNINHDVAIKEIRWTCNKHNSTSLTISNDNKNTLPVSSQKRGFKLSVPINGHSVSIMVSFILLQQMIKEK